MTDFTGWIPMRIFWRDARPLVDWGWLDQQRFTDPFFAQTIQPCVRHPANLLFRPQTPLENLGEIAARQPSVKPTGFIFHMSRCGSTLISQMLAVAPENIVLSEPGPVDDILRAHFRDPRITEEQRVQWLQWLVAILGWRRQPAEKNLFIKFDCWHALFLPLIQRAFPGVPWIFVYRDPVEVMASHVNRHRGAQMIPTVLDPGLFGWDYEMVSRMSLDEYGARVLAKICEAMLARAQAGEGKFINYRQLPTAVWPELLDYWTAKFSGEENARMLEVAGMNAKNPGQPFEPDGPAKRAAVTAELREITQRWLDPVYQQLETQRLVQGFA